MKPQTKAPTLLFWMSVGGISHVAVGVAALIGYMLRQPSPLSFFGHAPVSGPTAGGLVVAGATWFALAAGRTWLARLLGAATLLWGAASLMLFGLAFAVSAHDGTALDAIAFGLRLKGHMSANVAASFTLLGLGLLFLAQGTPPIRRLGVVAGLVLTLSLLAVAGYVTVVGVSTDWWRYMGMALPSAGCFLVSALLLLGSTAELAAARSTERMRGTPFFSAAGAILTAAAVILVVGNGVRQLTARSLFETDLAQRALDGVAGAAAEADAALSSYMVSRDETYLRSHAQARNQIQENLYLYQRRGGGDALRAAAIQDLTDVLKDAAWAARRVLAEKPEADAQSSRLEWLRTRELLAARLASALQKLQHLEADQARAIFEQWESSEDNLQGCLLGAVAVAAALLVQAFRMLGHAQQRLQESHQRLEEKLKDGGREKNRLADLVRSEESILSSFADGLDEPVWLVRPNGVVTYFNHRGRRFCGLPDADASRCAPGELVHPDDAAEFLDAWARSAASGQPFTCQARIREAATGTWHRHRFGGSARRTPDGLVGGWVIMAVDQHSPEADAAALDSQVMERALELAESESRLRTIADRVPGLVAYVDRHQRYRLINQAFKLWYGQESIAWLGMTIEETSEPELFAVLKPHIGRVLQGEHVCFEHQINVLNGQRWVRSEYIPDFHGPGGDVSGFSVLVLDITERVELQASLGRARERALESARLKSEFLATMSHEIRTPMNGILGMTGLLMESQLSPEQKEMASILQNSAEGLLTIINDILDYARMEAGKLRLESIDFSLRDVIEETLVRFAPPAHAKHIDLLCDIEPRAELCFFGDSARIRQVLDKLVANAVKFTAKGDITVLATWAGEEGGCTTIRIEVRDTGIGIPVPDQGRLFQPFTQADGTSSRRYGGVGLGLAICKQVLDLMGGKIGLNSIPGQGSQFWFEITLPRRPSVPPTPFTWPASTRVLLVEDHPPTRVILQRQLDQLDFAVETAADAAEALRSLQAARAAGQPHALILLKWELPDGSGARLARKLIADTEAVRPAVVVLSNTGPSASEVESLACEGRLVKPVREAPLRRCLGRALDARVLPGAEVQEEAGRPAAGVRVLVVEGSPSLREHLVGRLRGIECLIDEAETGEQALDVLCRTPHDFVVLGETPSGLDPGEVVRRIRSGLLPRVNAQIPIFLLASEASVPEDATGVGITGVWAQPLETDRILADLARCGVVAARHTPEPSEILDLAHLETMRRLDHAPGGAVVRELAAQVETEFAVCVRELRRGVAESDAILIADKAHGLLGSLTGVGARELRVRLLSIEHAAKRADFREIERALDDIEEVWARFRSALQAHVAT